MINRDVKPYALMVGVPAKQIGWVGVSGNRLKFIDGKASDEFGEYIIIDNELKEIK